jgi:hypothetical protein
MSRDQHLVDPDMIARDETLERLVSMTIQTNLVALDKVLATVRRSNEQTGYAAAAARVSAIAERMARAAQEVRNTLPE